MRDILFKNLTSMDKKRKIVCSSETVDKQGVRSVIKRHFVCMVKELIDGQMESSAPYLYVLKARNTKEQTERFFCRIKGSLFAVKDAKLYKILFMHSLKIDLTALPPDLVINQGENPC
jgi:hypothetical protein